MFVDEALEVDVSAEALRLLFSTFQTSGALQRAADEAFRAGRQVLANAEFAPLVSGIRAEVLPAYLRGELTVIPMRWLVAESPEITLLDANLEYQELDERTCLLSFRGTFRLPEVPVRPVSNVEWTATHSATRMFLDRICEYAGGSARCTEIDDERAVG
ncbi:hypothetical protein SAMN05444157_3564 [Frankineae bacterium MT45]|nr:hypothetical protein SAMN05444157_3564 [Frankineae bacterium MT45]